VGRLKANAMRDVVHQHHPAARVFTSALHLSGRTRQQVRDLIRYVEADLVICATDSRESRLLINRMCLEEGLPLILGGCWSCSTASRPPSRPSAPTSSPRSTSGSTAAS
jgi:molybdopterin/thiamine biosynthesis adenylyltransferase